MHQLIQHFANIICVQSLHCKAFRNVVASTLDSIDMCNKLSLIIFYNIRVRSRFWGTRILTLTYKVVHLR